ncbi:MAG: glycoside hydrolase family 97 protein [Bacteroidota bacterium]|nr:glycoside hydrolase family 97 protein [Bacteroidota bacterium]
MRIQLLSIILVLITGLSFGQGKKYAVKSPDSKIEVRVSTGAQTSYSVYFEGKELVASSPISMKFDNGIEAGVKAVVIKAEKSEGKNTIIPAVRERHAKIDDHYNQVTLFCKGNYNIVFRAYNDGVAYRFATTFKKPVTVISENANFEFSSDNKIYFPKEDNIYSHQEREYIATNLSAVKNQFSVTPALVESANGPKVLISEADLYDYPGMFLEGSANASYGLHGKFAAYPLETEKTSDRDVRIKKYADFLAKTTGTRQYPWRAMVIAEKDGQLVESDLIYKLSKPLQIQDPSWVKPGKVAWDWWNAWNIYGVDFKSGVNTETYKYYVDFASKYGLEYIILDEGWYDLNDLMKVVPSLDMQELVNYANKKNVGIILWTTWKALDDKMTEALDQFHKWGIKGVKVDFMQRDDQWMVNFYLKVAQETAKRQMLVDFHGAYKPTGMRRAYPNVISHEGVRGLENDNWSDYTSPEQALILPFTRNVVGPMDYTPGAMKNASKDNFRAVFSEPMSQGTRCQQLAMYVVFRSPLQMLSDNPSNYYKEPECMEFLKQVPTVWDDTKVLDGKISDYIVVASKSGDKWFMGAMTDWTERDLEVNFDFLGEGDYTIDMWQDGVNANTHASDFKKVSLTVNKDSKLKIHLASGGGMAAILHK